MSDKHDPNSKRMFRPDMGACNAGCKCQTRWTVEIEDGEVAACDLTSDHPCHLRLLEKGLEKDVTEEDGEFWLTSDIQVFTPDDPPDEDWKPEPLEIVEVDGVKCYRETCAIIKDWVQLELEQHMTDRKLPNGAYSVTMEYACYERDVWYGAMEPDSDAVYEVEPLPAEAPAEST